jgi:ribosomal protein S18 acetylase RimI-like enzyme
VRRVGAARAGNVRRVSVQIDIASEATDELRDALSHLLPQLSSSPPPTLDELALITTNPESVLFVARLEGRIVGSLTLIFYRIPTGLKSWIEDVVVDESARGHGIGELLNRAALDEARRRGAKAVSLTSRPSREAANRLYQRIGFESRPTNVYRYDLID